jgi:uncharacterized LabA/DUF88 family protein
MKKVSFLIDGFNFYYSVVRVQQDFNIKAKWFNYRALCEFYKIDFQSKKQNYQLEINEIYYFTSLIIKKYNMSGKDYDRKITKQLKYNQVLEDMGIIIEKGKFKKISLKCPNCNFKYNKPVEKQTDIKIAVKLLEILYLGISDVIFIISGDTDLTPAIKSAKKIFKDKLIVVVIPYGNRSEELKKEADFCYSLPAKVYSNYLLPNPYVLKNGYKIYKPENW